MKLLIHKVFFTSLLVSVLCYCGGSYAMRTIQARFFDVPKQTLSPQKLLRAQDIQELRFVPGISKQADNKVTVFDFYQLPIIDQLSNKAIFGDEDFYIPTNRSKYPGAIIKLGNVLIRCWNSTEWVSIEYIDKQQQELTLIACRQMDDYDGSYSLLVEVLTPLVQEYRFNTISMPPQPKDKQTKLEAAGKLRNLITDMILDKPFSWSEVGRLIEVLELTPTDKIKTFTAYREVLRLLHEPALVQFAQEQIESDRQHGQETMILETKSGKYYPLDPVAIVEQFSLKCYDNTQANCLMLLAYDLACELNERFLATNKQHEVGKILRALRKEVAIYIKCGHWPTYSVLDQAMTPEQVMTRLKVSRQ